MDQKIHRLNENLQGTTRNLRSLDRMLDEYRDVGRERRSAVDRLRDEVGRTHERLREERLHSPGQRDYGSDSEYEASPTVHRRRRKRSMVRFADDMNRELHDIHHTVRDLSSNHLRLEDSLDQEVDRRERNDMETKRTIREISDTLKRFPSADPVADRVEKRLQMIQRELEADRALSSRHDELMNLSTELRNALHQHQLHSSQAAVEERMKSTYLQNETQRHRLESDMESLRRKLDMTEGSRSALQQQVDDMRNQMHRMELERNKLQSQLDESRLEEDHREKRRQRSLEDTHKKSLEREIQELRAQLSRGTISELDELRRALEKSERQRTQLSDHIETLSKDMDNREKQSAKLITQLKEISDKYEDAERHKNHLLIQVEDTMQKLRENGRELEKTTNELRSAQLSIVELEKKKEEFKSRAQETVRQWKLKVKQLERELDRQKHGTQQMMQRNEQLIKETEAIRQQNHTFSMQLENMRRELGDALAVRAAQDEQIRLKDVEINELKSYRMDLDKELRDTRTVADRLENELHMAESKAATLMEERNRMEDKFSSLEAAHLLAQDQANQLQQELKELSNLKAELATSLSEADGKIHDMRQNYIELQHREKAAREENKLYQHQLNEERENSHINIENLKRDLNEAKVREAHVVQDLQRRLKKDKAEYEAALQALKMELSEDKSTLKISRRNEEKYRKEAEILQNGMNKLEDENHKLMARLEQAKHEFETQTQLAETDMSRVRNLADELYQAQKEVKRHERHLENVVQDFLSEVDSLMDLAATGSLEKVKTVHSVKGAPNGLATSIVDIKTKMKWLRGQLRDKIKTEQKLRRDLREALTCTEIDRKYLLQELQKREEVLDELVTVKQELSNREIENMNAVEVLQEHLLDLTDELELRKIKEEEKAKLHESEKQQIIDEIEDLRDKEKLRIEERYHKLQKTMKALQDEIRMASVNNHKVHELEKNLQNMKGSTPKKKRVRIVERPTSRSSERSRSQSRSRSASPRRRPVTPPTRLPCGHDDTLPMAMTDEDFERRFVKVNGH
ncbi:hypothetical protein CHS0354_004321 [Potamilus streckersoni]|uniref:Uncharacterized protein n=1 Tax=Potamilus streckersoni TaxID=2493646 RepID=A0AAE0SGI7_9BIVA|nr:hypothetical protein CHS0354_004321 [Potamilus streckersoni]